MLRICCLQISQHSVGSSCWWRSGPCDRTQRRETRRETCSTKAWDACNHVSTRTWTKKGRRPCWSKKRRRSNDRPSEWKLACWWDSQQLHEVAPMSLWAHRKGAGIWKSVLYRYPLLFVSHRFEPTTSVVPWINHENFRNAQIDILLCLNFPADNSLREYKDIAPCSRGSIFSQSQQKAKPAQNIPSQKCCECECFLSHSRVCEIH